MLSALTLIAAGGCATLAQLSEKGGLIGSALRGDAPSGPVRAPASAAVRGAPRSAPELALPYRPADFDHRAADGEFAWHWTVTRTGERVEVKGLIENRSGRAVQGVTFALSGPGGRVFAESPGLIRPGQMSPFYFSAVFPGDERQTQLSITAVDRAPAGPPDMGPRAAAPRAAAPAPQRPAPRQFTDHARDGFFTLQWKTVKTEGGVRVSGRIENREGSSLTEVTLLISAYGPAGETLKTEEVVLSGEFDKKEDRPFAVTLPLATEPERVSVTVYSYQFDPRGL